jgi:hypothetical protein
VATQTYRNIRRYWHVDVELKKAINIIFLYHLYRVLCSVDSTVCIRVDHRECVWSHIGAEDIGSRALLTLCQILLHLYLFIFLPSCQSASHAWHFDLLRTLKLVIECCTADTMCLNTCRYFHCIGKKDSRNWARGEGFKGYAWQASTRHATSQRHYIIRVTTPYVSCFPLTPLRPIAEPCRT